MRSQGIYMKTALGKTEKITSNDSPDLQRKKIQECIVKFAEETLAGRTVECLQKIHTLVHTRN
jgi:hypothetical protein